MANQPNRAYSSLFNRKSEEKVAPTPSQPSEAVKEPKAVAEQVVTPWDVAGEVTETGEQLGIDYDKLISKFGTRPIDAELLARFTEVTGHKPHIFLRRGMFFSHRFEDICALYLVLTLGL